jgi:hypothetical protein
VTEEQEQPKPNRCSGCYDSFSGPWCDNCDTWPCTCVEQPEGLEVSP